MYFQWIDNFFAFVVFFVFLEIRSGMFGDRGSLDPDSFDLSQQTQHLTGDTQNISTLETNMKSQHHHCWEYHLQQDLERFLPQ